MIERMKQRVCDQIVFVCAFFSSFDPFLYPKNPLLITLPNKEGTMLLASAIEASQGDGGRGVSGLAALLLHSGKMVGALFGSANFTRGREFFPRSVRCSQSPT